MYKIRTEHYNIEHVLRCLSLSLSLFEDDFVHSDDEDKIKRFGRASITYSVCPFSLYISIFFRNFLLQRISSLEFFLFILHSFILFSAEDFPASSSSSLLGNILSSSASRLSRESPWPEFPSVASLKNGRPSRRSVFPPSRVPGSSPGWLSRPPEAFATHPMIQSSDDHFRRHHQHLLLEKPSLRSVPSNLANNPVKIRIINLNWIKKD